MSPQRDSVAGLTFDTGALLAVDRGDERLRELLRRAARNSWPIAVPAGVLAQAWRGGPRQARMARLLAQPEVSVPVLDEVTARAVGQLCGLSGHHDVVDAHVAMHALRENHAVVTSDPGDIHSVAPSLTLLPV